ncbi:hypothetical protein SK128_007873 [Halocaridina rubra]|uniref:Reverse transcriptase domain-containing protein n=1 Tax=Halocaridina rubra TaxID=373956 RepID=A0AAN8X6J8_HALRR
MPVIFAGKAGSFNAGKQYIRLKTLFMRLEFVVYLHLLAPLVGARARAHARTHAHTHTHTHTRTHTHAHCIFLDFQKAFDTVPHGRLIRKLQSMARIGGNIIGIR